MKPLEDSTRGTSLSLLARARENDDDAWRRLVELYAPLVFHWCRESGLANDDVPDVVQEVFRTVHGGLARFRRDPGEGSFRGWLRTITRSRLLDFYRKNGDRVSASGGSGAHQQLLGLAAEEEESETSVVAETTVLLRANLERIRAEFEERTWQAFWLTAAEERAPAEVARKLGISVNAVYKAKSRVLRRLRDELDGMFGYDEA